MPAPRLTLEMKRRIEKRYRAGDPTKIIASDFNIHHTYPSKLSKEAGLPRRDRRTLVGDKLRQVRRLYKKGMRIAAIAASFNVTVDAVRYAVGRAKQKPRPIIIPLEVAGMDERTQMHALREQGFKLTDIAKHFGVSYDSCRSKLRHDRERSAGYRNATETQRVFEIPDEVWADRDRRLGLTPRDLSATLCGDPLPGYSALERRA